MSTELSEAYICDGVRTPIGRYGGVLSSVRADDLTAIPIVDLLRRQPQLDGAAVDDVILGCANQAGEDNRNVARMASLLAGLPDSVPGATVNRLCGSGLNAVSVAAQAFKAGEAEVIIAGGVESISRAPFVMGKAAKASAHRRFWQSERFRCGCKTAVVSNCDEYRRIVKLEVHCSNFGTNDS